MDEYEKIALDLEIAQTERYRNHPHKIDFWQDKEVKIYESIKVLRSLSKTHMEPV